MIKALKKLKVWSKKKKRKGHHHVYQPPPSTSHCCSCSYAQPSAPPLPSWFDFDQNREAASVSAVFQPYDSDPTRPQPQVSSPQPVSETTPLYAPPLPVSTSSYQQYIVQSPVYGVPVVVPEQQTERTAGLFGCVGGAVMIDLCKALRHISSPSFVGRNASAI